jgi:DnaJ-class molecular chaperone
MGGEMTEQTEIDCPDCLGTGDSFKPVDIKPGPVPPEIERCERCGGTGRIRPQPGPTSA